MKAILAVMMLVVASAHAVPMMESEEANAKILHAVVPMLQGLVQNGVQGFVQAVLNLVPVPEMHFEQIGVTVNTLFELFQATMQTIIAGKTTNVRGVIAQLVATAQQFVAWIADSLLLVVRPRMLELRFLSALGNAFNNIVDTVSGTISNIGTAVGTAVTNVVNTATPHVDNLLTELQGHGENAIQSVVNAIAGINQGIGY